MLNKDEVTAMIKVEISEDEEIAGVFRCETPDENGVRRFVWAHYRQRSAGIGFEIINEGSTDAFSTQEAKLHATRSAGVGDWGKAWRDATGEFIRADGRSDGWIKFNGNKRLRGLKSNGLGYTEYVVLYLE